MRGGAITSAMTFDTDCHVTPPSIDLSSRMFVQQKPPFGSKLVSVVNTVPLPSTCGSRYVSPCGLLPAVGSNMGDDHAVCVPSALASAYATQGLAVIESNTVHIA